MTEFAAVVASIEKGRIVIANPRGSALQCEYVSGKLPRVGNKGIAVVDEAAKKVKFRGPRGAAHLRLVGPAPEI
jgi:hypothetical protein